MLIRSDAYALPWNAQMVEMEQSRRLAADDRERISTSSLMTVELEKRELENKVINKTNLKNPRTP